MSNLKDFFPPGFVEWQAPITSALTMEAGKGYPVNTSGGAITVTLPASASLGDTIELNDYARTWGSNNLTINLNGHKMAGGDTNPIFNDSGTGVTLVYADSTKGWLVQQDEVAPFRASAPPGNQEYTSAGTYTFTVPANVTQLCVVCVGAGGKNGIGNSGQAGGGGALAWKNSISVTPGSTGTVTVGGPGNHSGNNGNAGGLSKFNYGGVDYAVANGGGGGNGDGSSGGNPGSGGTVGGNYDGGGSGGSGGQDSSNHGGPGGGAAGGYSGAGGAGASAPNTGASNGSSGSGGAGGGGGKGGQSEMGGGGGGGTGIYGIGSNGTGGQGQAQNSNNGSGGNGGSGGGNGGAGQGQNGGNGGFPGGGHGGCQSSGSGNGPAGGAVRIIWGVNRSFPNNAAQV
tara:strand:- start:4514 stop:5710 length:1197 start_codon:yes stop_codon:yes gene_type:complete